MRPTVSIAALCATACLAAVFALLPISSAIAQDAVATGTPEQQLNALRERTSLEGKTVTPWHMLVNFNVRGLDGKPSDEGTLEMWWAAPGQRRTVITSRLLHSVTPAEGGEPAPLTEEGRREKYLVQLLMQKIVSPVEIDLADVKVSAQKISRQKVSLECLIASPEERPKTPTMRQTNYCLEPASGRLRVITNPVASTETVINRTATFQNVQLGMETSVALETPAITGTIQSLSGWHADQQPETLTQTAAPSSVSSAVTAGLKLGGLVPEYPQAARMEHATGTVVMGATISTQGTIKDLTVLASRRPDLADAAKKAVATWTYKPYLLNGKPTEVDTTIIVHFNMS